MLQCLFINRVVKRISFNNFELVLMGFELNSPDQKKLWSKRVGKIVNLTLSGFGLNESKQVESQITNFIQIFKDKIHKLFKLNIYKS